MTDNTGENYIKPYNVNGEVTPDNMRLEQLRQRFEQINADSVHTVGTAYVSAASALATAARNLEQHAEQLSGRWRGKTATTALRQMGQLNTTAVEMANKSRDTGDPLKWLATTILPWFRDTGSGLDHGGRVHVGPIDMGREDGQARDLMDRLNNRLAEAHNAMPERVVKDLPPAPGRDDHGPLGTRPIPSGGGPPPSFGGPGGELPDGPGSYPGPGDPYNRDPDGGLHTQPDYTRPITTAPGLYTPGDPYGPGGEYPGPGGGLPGDGTSLAGVPDGGGFGGGPGSYGGGGAGTGGFGDPAPGGSYSGTGGAPGSGPGAGGTPFGPGGAGARPAGAGTGGLGRGMVPPMGGAGGQDEQERERSTWLTEDEDVWGLDNNLPPPVIE